MRMHLRSCVWCALSAVAFLGCGSSDGGDAPGGGQTDAGVDAEASAETGGDADVRPEADAATATQSVRVTFVDWPGDAVPASGVTVAFDAPDGTRSEATTGSDGRVAFDVSDWSVGTASVTAYAPGRQMVSRVGIVETDGEVELALSLLGTPAGFVKLSGSVANMAVPDATLTVTASTPNAPYLRFLPQPGPDWTIHVPAGTPTTIMASARDVTFHVRGFDAVLEWSTVDVPAASADTVVSIDAVADTAVATKVSGSYPFPPRAESPLRGAHSYGWVWVVSKESRGTGMIGDVSRIAVSDDGQGLDYDLEIIDAPAGGSPVTCYLIVATGKGVDPQSASCEAGLPAAGPQDPGMLDVPDIVTPIVSAPMHDAIQWELFDTDVHVALMLTSASTEQRYITFGHNGATKIASQWIVLAPDDATTLVVPQPPTTASIMDVFGIGTIRGFVQAWRQGSDGFEFSKVAFSRTFQLAP